MFDILRSVWYIIYWRGMRGPAIWVAPILQVPELSLPLRASEVYFVSEVILEDSEVLPSAKWANLTSLVRQYKLHCAATSLSRQ